MGKSSTLPPSLRIEELFLVSSSFAHRSDFLTLDRRKPLGDLEVDAQFRLIQGLAPSVIGVTVRVETKADADTAYKFHAEMMAIIRVDGGEVSTPIDKQLLHSGVTILFPFVRETIANLTMRGRFGAMWIKPINFQTAIEAMLPPTSVGSSGELGKQKRRSKRAARRQ